MAILSLGKEAFLDFWGSLEDAEADCAAIADRPATSAVAVGAGGPEVPQKRRAVTRALASVWCEDCSLVVFEGQAYHDAWHGIASTAGTGGGGRTAARSAAATETIPEESTNDIEAVPSGNGSSRNNNEHEPGGPTSTDGAAARYSDDDAGGSDGKGGVGGVSQKRLSFTIRRVARVLPPDSVMEHPEARSEMERRRRGFERSVTDTGTAVDAPAAKY